MQAQLLRIRAVLSDVSLNYINKSDPLYGAVEPEEKEGDISVVQHMSAACKASRTPELMALPAAWLLRQVRKEVMTPCPSCTLSVLKNVSPMSLFMHLCIIHHIISSPLFYHLPPDRRH
jgi:hypothetical protein